jgi:hypothetical protein
MPVPVSKSYSVADVSTSDILAWLKESLECPGAELHTKLRGNILHLLCETSEPLDQGTVLLKLVRALLDDRDQGRLQQAYPQVYQIYLYSRLVGQAKPEWTAPLYLNRLERHLAQLVLESQDEADLKAAQVLLADYSQDHPDLLSSSEGGSGAMVLSNLSLARKGDPDAIAWYLSETLSALDVGVWVSIKAIPGTAHLRRTAITIDDASGEAESLPSASTEAESGDTTIPRLWILCEATYSPDPSLIARPTAERLRMLNLTQFKDAVLLLQVRGENKPDWSLRIDLTPPEEMLREWARWGDADALERLLSAAVANHGSQVEAELANNTLHLICRPQVGQQDAVLADGELLRAAIVETLITTLNDLAPQGIHRAVLYGQPAQTETNPAWVEYLDLPATQHEALADSPEYLGQTGDLPAIAFLLTRQLNPSLDDRLATGGLRVQLLCRDKLLHVMVDSPLPPQRRLVAPLIHDYLHNLSPVGIEGVRIYGRRSGQPKPAWSYGQDFLTRSRLIPEATPEFTASEAYVNELLVRPDGPITTTEVEAEAEQTALVLWWQHQVDHWRERLVRSHLFTSQVAPGVLDAAADSSRTDGLKIAVVWAAVGILVALQLDWLLGQILTPPSNSAKAEPLATSRPAPDQEDGFEQALSDLNWPSDNRTAGEDGFVGSTNTTAPGNLATSPDQPLVALDELVDASPFSTFNSQQLNEKIALYRQRLETSGPADVMIVGSSRALRGVDPVALRKELAAMGYENISVFNFGINGATAQVVDLVIRQVLEPDQLPKLIIWADGARAFNSGREDVTYNAIVASSGYRELLNQRADASADTGTPTDSSEATVATPSAEQSLPNSYAAMDQWMSDRVASFSAVYGDRDQLKNWLQEQLLASSPLAEGGLFTEEKLDAPMPEGSAIDFDGFLPLAVRFNPATYYQTYARVSGTYDGDYEDFRLDGAQTEAFQSLLSFTQANNIPIVFVNTPLTDEYLDDYREDAEAEFLRYMFVLSTAESGFIFRDLGQVWPQRYDYFSDPSHLNRYGAYQVSNRLAQDPLIAWPQKAPPESP